MIRRPPRSTLSPSTTLFRSSVCHIPPVNALTTLMLLYPSPRSPQVCCSDLYPPQLQSLPPLLSPLPPSNTLNPPPHPSSSPPPLPPLIDPTSTVSTCVTPDP